MRHPALHLFDLTPDTLKAWAAQRGMPPFRAVQVFDWVYRKGVVDPAAMSNLANRDRDLLASEMTFLSGTTIRQQDATDGTRKLLIEWDDHDGAGPAVSLPATAAEGPAEGSIRLRVLGPEGPDAVPAGDTSRQTECVMIPAVSMAGPTHDDVGPGGEEGDEYTLDDAEREPGPPRVRRTACISSQVGCPVGCRFCASGLGGLDGNLSAGRIVEQVWRLGQLPGVGRISNVVFMGMGEPLSNFANVTRAIRTLAAPWGMGISARKITISTVGLPRAIERLAEEMELPVTLALSLHAPNDALRRELIPWAGYTTIAELLAACAAWFRKTGREITLEYTLLRAVNDRPEHAEELARLARTLRANVNLIRYNEVAGMPFGRPRTEDVLAFQRTLRERQVNTHIRRSRGRDIAAACGQLRHESAAGPARAGRPLSRPLPHSQAVAPGGAGP